MRGRRYLALLLALPAVAASACGSSSNKAKEGAPNPAKQNLPNAGGRIMPASDTATVELARRQLEAACPNQLIADTPPDPQPAVRTLIREQHLVGPNAVFESGNAERAVPMSILLQHEARVAARCGLTRAATQLRRAAQPVSG